MADILEDEIASRLEKGERIAFLRTNSDGDTELTVLSIEILKKKTEKS
jgi:hypothetical protein